MKKETKQEKIQALRNRLAELKKKSEEQEGSTKTAKQAITSRNKQVVEEEAEKDVEEEFEDDEEAEDLDDSDSKIPLKQTETPLEEDISENKYQSGVKSNMSQQKPLNQSEEEHQEKLKLIMQEIESLHNEGLFRYQMMVQLVNINEHLRRIAESIEKLTEVN